MTMGKGGILSAVAFYSHALIQLLIEPGMFFKSLPETLSPARVWGYLGGCTCFFALASLLTGATLPAPAGIMALVFAANAAGMVGIGAAIGYAVMVMVAGRKGSFFLVFGIYVFASGVTWLISWLPFMLWFTEPWRLWLTMRGFCLSCGLSRRRAVVVVLVSAAVQWCLVYSAMQAFIR